MIMFRSYVNVEERVLVLFFLHMSCHPNLPKDSGLNWLDSQLKDIIEISMQIPGMR